MFVGCCFRCCSHFCFPYSVLIFFLSFASSSSFPFILVEFSWFLTSSYCRLGFDWSWILLDFLIALLVYLLVVTFLVASLIVFI